MVVRNSKLISMALIMALAVPAALASNNLVQMDLKKSSGDAVDVTLFTSSQYNDNVMVRQKSDNKYVILIPQVQSSGFSRAGLSGVRDLISNVDVKTVNDTTGGYTKVTLITTKPIDIRTRTLKSAPITQEQEEYKTLIAQANTIKNNIGRQSLQQTPQKTEVTVNKAPAAPANDIQKNTAKPLMEPIKQEAPKKVQNKPQIQLTEINPEEAQKQNRKEYLQRLIEDSKDEEILIIPHSSVEEHVPEVNAVAQNVIADKSPMTSSLKNKVRKALPSKFPKAMLLLLPLLVLISVVRALTKHAMQYVEETQNLSAEEVAASSDITENSTDESGISWQDKYKLYLDESAVPIARANNQGNYVFIKNIAPAVDEIEAKRANLEKMVTDVEPVSSNEVHKEDEVIHKTIKFKAFDNKTSLSTTRRGVKSRFKGYENKLELHEQKNIELGTSALHSNPRNLQDANLKVSDVDENRIKYEPKEYIMSSVDEYFSLIDREEAEIKKENRMSNPIAKSKDEIKFDNNLIVKAGFDIDAERGFYIVNKDGQNSLVGKIKDEMFVLKNLGSNITNPLQVRHDNGNVYMVKADGFKSLVEVNEDKMGVLIEL